MIVSDKVSRNFYLYQILEELENRIFPSQMLTKMSTTGEQKGHTHLSVE